MRAISERRFDLLHHPLETLANITVREPQHGQAQALQKILSASVATDGVRRPVDFAIHFDRKPVAIAIEI